MITGTPTILQASVSTPSDLAGVPDDQFQDGDWGHTSSPRRTWQIDRSSVAFANGVTVVATLSGNGRWLVVPIGPGFSGANEFVFRPGDPTPVGGVYTDWSELVAAAVFYPGDKEIYFSDDFQACQIPSGIWDLGDGTTSFVGSLRETNGSGTSVRLLDGARLRGVRTFRDISLSTDNSSVAAPVLDLSLDSTGPNGSIACYGATTLTTNAAGSLVGCTTLRNIVVRLYDRSVLSSLAGAAVVREYVIGGTLDVELYDASDLGASTLATPGAATALLESGAVSCSTVQPGTGAFATTLRDRSFQHAYVDVVPLLGSTNVQGAIDALKVLAYSTWTSVASPNDLSLLNDAALFNGQLIWDRTLLTYWTLDKNATDAVAALQVVVTLSGTGRFLRMITYNSLHWIGQSVWTVNPTTGSDLNSGLAGAPLATAREWWRRTNGKYSGIPTLTCETDMSSADGLWYPTFNVMQNALRAFTFSGTNIVTRTVVTLTSSGAAQNPAGNTSPTFADGAVVSWAADVGNFIDTTSGPARRAQVLADLGGGVARVSQWYDPATLASATAPANVSYTVSRPSQARLSLNNMQPMGGSQVTYKRFSPTDTIGGLSQALSIIAECKITLGTTGGVGGRATGGLQFVATVFSGATFPIVAGGSNTLFILCGWTSCGVGITAGGSTFQSNVFHASSLTLGATQAGDDQQGSALLAADNGFFSAGTAIALSKRSMANVRATSSATIYGSGNTTGVSLRGRSTLIVRGGYVPTLTGVTEISWANGANQIPPLVAGAVVPAAAACATWAAWNAAPFSRYCYNYGSAAGGDGSALIT